MSMVREPLVGGGLDIDPTPAPREHDARVALRLVVGQRARLDRAGRGSKSGSSTAWMSRSSTLALGNGLPPTR